MQLFFLCAHPSLTPASAVALTLHAVGGLTTRQIAQAYLVPEATMAQRISRPERTVGDLRFDQPGDLATVLRVLYLVFNEGYTGDVDLAAEAIRLTRQLASLTDDEETAGLLALLLLHHARRPARTRRDGSPVPLAEQDRARRNTSLIADGVTVLRTALGRDRLGEFQAQAAIAALHADAPRAEETDWVQIVGWYDELLRLTDSPVVQLNRAIAIGEADADDALKRMTIQHLENVGIVVEDLAAATKFFVELGLKLLEESQVEGGWVDRVVGLEGVRVDVAMVETPDGHGRLELMKFNAPPARDGDRNAPPNTLGIRGPEGIIVMLAEQID